MTHTRVAEVESTLARVADLGGGVVLLHSDDCTVQLRKDCPCNPLKLWQPPHGDAGYSMPVHLGGSLRQFPF